MLESTGNFRWHVLLVVLGKHLIRHECALGVELAVRDTGTGISADVLPHLFERVHRVEGARGRSIEGSGIGLALVQELVRLQGGTISVQSEVDVGTTFTVRLPLSPQVGTGLAWRS